MSFSDHAIILKSLNLGEADRLLTLFTKYHGKLAVVAKGVRKISSRRGGHLDLFNQIKAFFYQPKRAGALLLLSEVELTNFFGELKKDLTKVGQVWYLGELVESLVPTGQIHTDVFQLLLGVLKGLDRSSDDSDGDNLRLIRQFEVELLKLLGFWSDAVHGTRFPQEPAAQAQFNQALIESILEKNLKTPAFLDKL